MGNFQQHVTCSTLTGIAIGAIGYQLGFSAPACLLSGGLCSMAGMLPDIDSNSSRSFQECIYFAAGICSVLFVEWFRQFGLDRDLVILGGSLVFLFVRFGVGEVIKKITSHRGMFHSIPAAILFGEIVFFLSTGELSERIFKAMSLSSGYFSHLILDEICSIDSRGKRLKKSFGTAMKLYDSKRMGTALTLYAAIAFLGVAAAKNPFVVDQWEEKHLLFASDLGYSASETHDFFGILASLEAMDEEVDWTQEAPLTALESEPEKTPLTVHQQTGYEHQLFSSLRSGRSTTASTSAPQLSSTPPSLAESAPRIGIPSNQTQRSGVPPIGQNQMTLPNPAANLRTGQQTAAMPPATSTSITSTTATAPTQPTAKNAQSQMYPTSLRNNPSGIAIPSNNTTANNGQNKVPTVNSSTHSLTIPQTPVGNRQRNQPNLGTISTQQTNPLLIQSSQPTPIPANTAAPSYGASSSVPFGIGVNDLAPKRKSISILPRRAPAPITVP